MTAGASFRILTHWHVTGTWTNVARILTRPEEFPRWWGDVYLSVAQITPGDANGVGQTVGIHSKVWLPYHLHWQARLT